MVRIAPSPLGVGGIPSNEVSYSGKQPSQSSSPPRTLSEASRGAVPSRWSALTVGNVVTPCTRNAPGLRNGTRAAISKDDPRRLVVWGITVISARSRLPKATLTMSAGRALPVMPKSMSQTSPRSGVGIFFVEGLKQNGRGGADLCIFKRSGIERQGAAQQFFCERALLFSRQMFEGVEQGRGLAGHVSKVAKPIGINDWADRALSILPIAEFLKERVSVLRLLHPDIPLEVLFDDDKCLVIAKCIRLK